MTFVSPPTRRPAATPRRHTATHPCLAAMLTAMTLLTGCGAMNWFGGDTETLWASKHQFIRIEPQGEMQGRTPPANQQPVNLEPARISGAFRLLLVRLKPDQEPQPLFSEGTLKKLGSYLSKGLAQAGPRRDVTFAVEDWYKSGGSFGIKGNKVVSARVFYAGGQLNIIFGSLLRDGPMSEGHAEMTARNPDPRINPFIPGARGASLKSRVMLSAPPGNGVFKAAGGRRNDWLVFNTQALVPRGPVSKEEKRMAARASIEVQELRREMEALKQQMRGGGGYPAGPGYGGPQAGYQQPGYPPQAYPQPGYGPPPGYTPPAYPQPAYPQPGYTAPPGHAQPPGYAAQQPATAGQAPPPAARPAVPQGETARRIAVLDNLRQKGLISQAEYDRKRQDILNGL